MNVVIINQQEVARLLGMSDCMSSMETVLVSLTRGECTLPLRQITWLRDRVGALALMPAYWASAGVVGLKAVTFFPGNEGTELDSHQGAVLLFEAHKGRLLAIVDATSITAVRTAAVSGVATKCLAREDAVELAIVGSGVQARAHLEAMLLCRPIRRVRVCSQTIERARAFVATEQPGDGVTITAVETVQEAVRNADIVCTCTSSSEPVLRGAWLADGVHINAVGSSVATARELDAEAVRRSRLFVDRMESALHEAGDFLLAKEEGAVDDSHIAGEIGQVACGDLSGRQSVKQVTLFKSVEIAVEDLAAALLVYEKALVAGAGIKTPLSGVRTVPA